MRRTAQVLAVGLVALLAGCTKTRTVGDATVITFEWWVTAAALAACVAAVPVGLLVRRRSFWGWILLVGGPVVGVVVVPMLALDKVTVAPDQFHLTTGFWFAPTDRSVRFSELQTVTVTKTETRGRRGRKNVSYDLKCLKKGGGTEVIPIGTLMEEGGFEAFVNAALAAGVPVINATGE